MFSQARSNTRAAASLLGPILAISIGGCAHTGNEVGVTHYLGWVRIEQPRTVGPDELHARSATAIGLWVRNGIGVGYEREQRVYVPLDCRLVVLVTSPEQLDRTVVELNTIGIREGLCVVPFSP